jgi:hypothetical protein
MNENLITALLSTDFGGYQFETLGNGSYSLTDDESATILQPSGDSWQIWVEGSLCITGELTDCIDWINEYLG